jgi:hypothetical protein
METWSGSLATGGPQSQIIIRRMGVIMAIVSMAVRFQEKGLEKESRKEKASGTMPVIRGRKALAFLRRAVGGLIEETRSWIGIVTPGSLGAAGVGG